MSDKTTGPEIFEYTTEETEHALAMFSDWFDEVIDSTPITNCDYDVLAVWASISFIRPNDEDAVLRLSDYEEVYRGAYESPDEWARGVIDGFSGDWGDERVCDTYFIRIRNNPWVYVFDDAPESA